MKTTERRHLKENDLAHGIAAAREFAESRSGLLKAVAAVLVLAAVAAIGVAIFLQRSSAAGERLLAEAMVALDAPVVPAGAQGADGLPAAATIGASGTFATEEAKLAVAIPKLQAAADAHPGNSTGITARYHLAGALAALGRNKEAITAFDEVVTRAGADSLYGRMARLGKAGVQAQSGQVDAAIAAWKDLAASGAETLPVDAILMQMAKAYEQQGNATEARKTYTEIVDQHPDSPYSADARVALDNLKG